MAIRTYKVTLDTKNSIAPEPVLLRQGDKTGAVVINATLMDNGSPVSLDGLTPMFKANTADGQAVIADSTGFNIVNAPGGEFTYQVPNALSSVPGKITTAYFSFSDSSGSESTFDVAFVIKKAVDITKPRANDYITIIDGTLQSLQQKIDAMNTDVQTILDAFNQGDFYNKSETDSRDASTLASAKSYADTGDAATLASAKAYANTQDATVMAVASSAIQDTGWVSCTKLAVVAAGNAYIRRIGKTVNLVGIISAKSGFKTGDAVSFPTGFSPMYDTAVKIVYAINNNGGTNGAKVPAGSKVLNFNWRTDLTDYMFFNETWITDDDFPN